MLYDYFWIFFYRAWKKSMEKSKTIHSRRKQRDGEPHQISVTYFNHCSVQKIIELWLQIIELI